MKRVTGIGGIFFKVKDKKQSIDWYAKHLGIPAGDYGHSFEWHEKGKPDQLATTTWSTFGEKSEYFGSADQQYMINYRVDDLVALLAALKEEGVTIIGEMQEFEYGKFAWILDPDGNRIELWEAVDQPLIDFEAEK